MRFELAQWYRSRGSKVVLDGLHVLSCPAECAAHADALAVGDGVQRWPGILADVESGCLRPKYNPYPAPLFRQMESEGCLLHRDWALYDTAHAVSL